MELGELVGRGRTSDVYAHGSGAVIKVPHVGVPDAWIELEAQLTRAVQASGVPAPEVLDVVHVQDRTAIVFERIDGPSMWQQMLTEPAKTEQLALDFAAIQRSLLQVGIPHGVPDFVDRLLNKIASAGSLDQRDRKAAASLVGALPRGASLLHGDLHPGNILMGSGGLVVIDWFDASIGHPVADIVRSALLIQPTRWAQLRHLPNATQPLLGVVQRGYLAGFQPELRRERDQLAIWQGVIAAGRLAEGAEVDESGLVRLWAERDKGSAERELLIS